MITNSFDPAGSEIITASMTTRPTPGFPEVMVVTFQPKTFNALLNSFQPSYCTQIAFEEDMGRNTPGNVYSFSYKGHPVGAYLSPVGAPPSGAVMEKAISLGAKRFVVFGPAGILGKESGIIVPTSAYRDEGLSYHYAAPSDYIDVTTAGRLSGILTDLKVPHACGRVWTTDAFFRETTTNMTARATDGCLAVDMECASLAALSQFRGVDVYHFVYSADSLMDGWDPRNLGTLASEPRLGYVRLALEVAIRL